MQEETTNLHKYVYSSEMVEFVTHANTYCQALEDPSDVDGLTFIEQSVRQLSGIYQGMLKIGKSDPVFESGGEPTVTEADWSDIYQKILRLLGPHNEYLRPAREDEYDRSDLVTHTISEDMSDVYQELRDFTAIYARGIEELMNDAAWELTVRFSEHWGMKLLNALGALHQLYSKGIDPSAEE